MSNNDDLKKQLDAIQNQLNQMQKEIQEERISINEAHMALLKICGSDLFYSSLEYKMSDWVLNSSIFLSALVGVIGNWFVSLWFQPRTVSVIATLGMSGGLLAGILTSILVRMFLIYRRTKREALTHLKKEYEKGLGFSLFFNSRNDRIASRP